jgi:alanyl-tRNA synthetase
LAQNSQAIVAHLAHELELYHRILKSDVTNVYKKLQRNLGGESAVDGIVRAGPSSRSLTPEEAYHLYTTYGFSPDRLRREGYSFDEAAFQDQLKKHQAVSRAGQGTFHSGLADTEANTVRGHTATHLLQQALREVLGPHVEQKGSNITAERVRFDFSQPDKLTEQQVREVERIVNEKITADLPVVKKLAILEEANALGAIGLFEEKYGDKVSIYLIGSDDPAQAYSKEFCSGPHVTHTGLIGGFKIAKEESSSAGIRRIKALVGEALDPTLKNKPIETL